MINPTVHLSDSTMTARLIVSVLDYFHGPDGSVYAQVEFADHTRTEASTQDITIESNTAFPAVA